MDIPQQWYDIYLGRLALLGYGVSLLKNKYLRE